MDKAVLIIEDHTIVRMLYSRFLVEHGYRVVEADSGEVGLELAVREEPDLILLDLSLPGIDGFETVRRLKTDARTRATPVLAFTAEGMDDLEERIEAAGFQGFLSKRAKPSDLIGEIERILGPSRERPSYWDEA